jgi:hypothetical protein
LGVAASRQVFLGYTGHVANAAATAESDPYLPFRGWFQRASDYTKAHDPDVENIAQGIAGLVDGRPRLKSKGHVSLSYLWGTK